MTDIETGFAGVAALLLLLVLRVPIGVALGLVSFVGVAAIRGWSAAAGTLKVVPYEFAANWWLSAIPMFLLMGAVAHHSGISKSLFTAARMWLGQLPGGLAIATNFASAGFAAASGSSIATSAAMGRIAIPEMLRQGYDKGLAAGVVASAGTVGALIPPSILFILYGVFAEQSITQLFIAGIIPGLLTAFVYAAMIYLRARISPAIAPKTGQDVPARDRWRALGRVWPMVMLVLGIVGGLYSGLVTPTEAGAFGAALAFAIAGVQGRLSRKVFADSVREAVAATARLMFVAIGAILLSHFMALSGVPDFLGTAMESWAPDPVLLILGTALIFIGLGMFVDPLGILFLTLPILLPMYEGLGLNLIWLGVVIVKFLEIGLLTPPVGLQIYIVKSVAGPDIDLETIFRGVSWFLLCEAIIMALIIAFPEIALYLPGQMR